MRYEETNKCFRKKKIIRTPINLLENLLKSTYSDRVGCVINIFPINLSLLGWCWAFETNRSTFKKNVYISLVYIVYRSGFYHYPFWLFALFKIDIKYVRYYLLFRV